jgi:hypothetical protein
MSGIALGAALVIIFVLHLIDKHNLWRKTAKIVLTFVGVSVIGFGTWFGWALSSEHRQELANAATEAKAEREKKAEIRKNEDSGFMYDKDLNVVLGSDGRPLIRGPQKHDLDRNGWDNCSLQDLRGHFIPPNPQKCAIDTK